MIPSFDHNNVLPPYIGGNPAEPSYQSPYKTTIMEVCQRFATSPVRISILKGFVSFRLDCINHGITQGFQWIDGSFLENIEARESRDPHDIDVVSFIFNIDDSKVEHIINNFSEFIDSAKSKARYKVDHYLVAADISPKQTIDYVRYWIQLFGHNRIGVWKGMLQLDMYSDTIEDNKAMLFLNSL